MVNCKLSLWDGWPGTGAWIFSRALGMFISGSIFTLVWYLGFLGLGFMSIVIGVIVSEPIVDIAVFGISFPRLFQYIAIAVFDVIRLAVVAFLMVAIFFVPECSYDLMTMWCGFKVEMSLLSVVILFVTIHIVMVIKSWRRSVYPPVESQP